MTDRAKTSDRPWWRVRSTRIGDLVLMLYAHPVAWKVRLPLRDWPLDWRDKGYPGPIFRWLQLGPVQIRRNVQL